MNIGVYRPGGLGDVFLLAPMLRAIRERYPDAWVHVWGTMEAAFVLQYLGLCDSSDSPHEGLRLERKLDALIAWDWPNNRPRLTLLARAHGIAWIAVDHAWAPAGCHQASWLFQTAQRVLDLPDELYSERPLPLPCYRSPDPVGQVLLHMGSTVPGKIWPRDRYLEMTKRLAPWSVAQLGCRPGHEPLPSIPLLRRPLLGVLWLLAGCRLLLVSDTGVAHLAGIIGAPAVVLFGPAQVKTWRPLGATVSVLQTCERMRDTDAPIFCPDHDCFAGLTVDLVEQTVRARLARTSAAPAARRPSDPAVRPVLPAPHAG